MAKIRFETGQVVNFDGNPTPQDVEEVAKKLGIKAPTQISSTGVIGTIGKIASMVGPSGIAVGATKQVGKDIIGGVNLASNLGSSLLKGTVGKAVSAITKKPQLPSKSIPTPSVLEPQGTAQKIGSIGAQVGEFLMPESLITDVTKTLSKSAEILNLAKKYGKAGEVVAKALPTLIRSAIEGLSTAGITGVQTGSVEKAKEAGIIGSAIPLVSSGLKGVGQMIAEKAIPLSSKEAYMIQSYKASKPFWERVLTGITGESKAPITTGQTAFEQGLAGTESMIGIQAKKASNNIWSNLVNPALEKSKVKQVLGSFWSEAKQKIIQDNPELNRQKDLLEALSAFKESYVGVKDVTMKELQNFKEGWAKFVPQKAYKGKDITGAFNNVRNTLAGLARNKIYNALGPEARQAYIDYGNLLGLQELGQKAMTGGGLKGGFGSFWSTVKDMGIVPIGTIGGQTIYKTGQGVELFGRAGAKFVSDIIPSPSTNQ